MPGPLDGVRVFDLTLWMVGPWASMQLGALGADVIHIEQPGVDPRTLAAVDRTTDPSRRSTAPLPQLHILQLWAVMSSHGKPSCKPIHIDPHATRTCRTR